MNEFCVSCYIGAAVIFAQVALVIYQVAMCHRVASWLDFF